MLSDSLFYKINKSLLLLKKNENNRFHYFKICCYWFIDFTSFSSYNLLFKVLNIDQVFSKYFSFFCFLFFVFCFCFFFGVFLFFLKFPKETFIRARELPSNSIRKPHLIKPLFLMCSQNIETYIHHSTSGKLLYVAYTTPLHSISSSRKIWAFSIKLVC